MREKQFIQIGIGAYPECIELAKEDVTMWGLPSDIEWTGVVVDFQPMALHSALIAIEENNLLDKVVVFNAAVSSFSGIREVKLKYVGDEVDGHSSLVDAKTDRDNLFSFDYRMYCATASLDNLINKVMRHKYVDIGLLALDVQGSEVDILAHYNWIHKPDYIKVETHSPELEKSVRAILEEGYRPIMDLTGEHDKETGRPNVLWERYDDR